MSRFHDLAIDEPGEHLEIAAEDPESRKFSAKQSATGLAGNYKATLNSLHTDRVKNMGGGGF